MAREEAEVRDEFAKGLVDLVVNNKALINMFTMLAEENIAYADAIVETIENHMLNTDKEYKLYALYLIDSIMKNVGKVYKDLFAKNIVQVFVKTFERVDEKTRGYMYKLRHTWTEVFSATKLYAIDCRVHSIDPAWPIVPLQIKSNIHVNPRFLLTTTTTTTTATTTTTPAATTAAPIESTAGKKQPDAIADTVTDPLLALKKKELVDKQQKLLEIKQKQLELELMRIEAQKKQLNDDTAVVRNSGPVAVSSAQHKSLLKPEAVRELDRTRNEHVNHCVVTKTADTVSLFPKEQQTGGKSNELSLDPRLARHMRSGKVMVPLPVVGARMKRSRSPHSENESCSNAVSTSSSLSVPCATKLQKCSRTVAADTSRSPSSSPLADSFDIQSLSQSNDSLVDSIVKKPFDDDDDDDDGDDDDVYNDDDDIDDIDIRKISKRAPDSTGSTSRNYFKKGLKVLSSKRSKLTIDQNSGGGSSTTTAATSKTTLSSDKTDSRASNKPVPATGANLVSASKSGSSNTITSSVSQSKTPLPQAPPPPKISDKQQLNSLRAKLANVPNLRKSVATSSSSSSSGQQPSPVAGTKPKLMHRSLTELIAEASEQLKRGEITAAEMSEMVQSLLLNKEMEQLNEAKKHEEDLQPISDDELVVELNRSADEDNGGGGGGEGGAGSSPSTADDDDDRHARKQWDRRRQQHKRVVRRQPCRRTDRRRSRATSFSSGDDTDDACDNTTKRRRHDTSTGNVMYFDTKRRNDKQRSRPRTFSPELPTSSTAATVPLVAPVLDYRTIRSPPPISGHTTRDLAPINPVLMDYVEKDTMRTITIDGTPREIRFYGDTAVIFLNWDDPREISFQNGARLVTFNGTESFLLGFNEPFKDLVVNGGTHKIRLGAPTRELIIDNNWYECIFGGAEFLIKLAGQMVRLRLDGPPPQVKISDRRRTDLVLGKINLIVDGQQLIPVFLDAKTQIIRIDQVAFTLRFANSLKTVLINEMPFRVEFNGKPKPMWIAGRKHFIRFSVMPGGVQQGCVRIANMEEWLTDTRHLPFANAAGPVTNASSLPAATATTAAVTSGDFDFRQHFQTVNMEDMLSSAVSTSMAPTIMGSYNLSAPAPTAPLPPPQVLTIGDNSPPPSQPTQSFPNLGNININELYQKLVATGIIPNSKPDGDSGTGAVGSAPVSTQPSKKKSQVPKSKKETDQESLSKYGWLEEVSLSDRDTLKIRNGSFINSLYTGMQCSTCGIRFLPEDSTKYSQHLDWHFHTSRLEKSVKTALNRCWYLTFDKFIENCNVENLMVKEKYWTEIPRPTSNRERAEEEAAAAQAIPTVASQSTYYMTEMCFVCYDKFDEFFHEDEEEWHLKNAVRIDNKLFHPICYEDYVKSVKKRESAMAADAVAATAVTTDSSDLMIIDVSDGTIDTKTASVTDTKPVDPDAVDNSILIIEELSPEEVRKRKEQNCPVFDLADDETTATGTNAVTAAIPFDFANVRVKTEPGLEIEPDPDILTDAVVECEPDLKLDDHATDPDDNQINKMNVEYSFDGYELPATNTTVPLAPLKITVSQNLLANKRQKTTVTSSSPPPPPVSETGTEDDIVIEKIDRNDTTATPEPAHDTDPVELKPHSIKKSLQNVQLTRKSLVLKGMDETSLCTIM